MLHAQRHYKEIVGHDRCSHIKRDRRTTIDRDEQLRIWGDSTMQVTGKSQHYGRDIVIDGEECIAISVGNSLALFGPDKITLQSRHIEIVAAEYCEFKANDMDFQSSGTVSASGSEVKTEAAVCTQNAGVIQWGRAKPSAGLGRPPAPAGSATGWRLSTAPRRSGRETHNAR